MKKAFTVLLSILRGSRMYLIIALDRLLMFSLIGTELPSVHYNSDLPKIDETTTEDEVLKIKNQSMDNRNRFINDYYKKARKRVIRASVFIVSVYLLSWLIF
jgi:hypothetical protein